MRLFSEVYTVQTLTEFECLILVKVQMFDEQVARGLVPSTIANITNCL